MLGGAVLAGAVLASCSAAPLARSADSGGATGEERSPVCPVAAAPAPLRRLSVDQYRNTLRHLFGDRAQLRPVLDELERSLAQLPRDGQGKGSFPGMDARVAPRHVSTYLQVAEAVARESSRDDARRAALAGDC